MRKVFTVNVATTPEDYLKNMLDCIDKNGELDIARDILEDLAFDTAESEEEATHIERIKLDFTLADYDEICDCYKNALNNLKAFIEKHSPECKSNDYCDRMVLYATRINKLIELDAPKFIIENEKYMLIDSILLYKTHAVGNLIEIKKRK